MDERGVFATWVRLTVATLVGIPVALAGLGTVNGTVASATTTLVPQTAFAIDGNPAGPNDFDAAYGPGTTPGGFPTTGLYVNRRHTDTATDPVACGAPDDAAVGGTKLEDGPNWPVGGPTPNGKTDLDSLYLASEKVDVNGQINDILYVGYLTCDDGPGTWQTSLYVDDGDNVSPGAGDLNGDYLFIFDFNPSSGAATTLMYRKVNGVWTSQPFVAGQIEGIAGAGGDFGEVAINLTALDIVDSATCRNVILQGQGASVTGGSLTSAVKDLILVPALPISNCGSLTVTKSSNPAGVASSAAFHYVVDQADAAAPGEPGTVHDATLTAGGVVAPGSTTEPDANRKEIDANIGVSQTQTWTNVISQPDYRIVEDSIPAGWSLDRIDCTYTDIFVAPPVSRTVAIYENGAPTGNRFLVPPATFAGTALPAASCTIVNATSGVVVAKAGSGDPAADFPFTVATAGPTTVASPTLGLGESSPVVAVTPGSSVTITENIPASNPTWTLESIACVASTSGLITPTATTATSVTFTTLPGQVITCTFTNRQSARITVAKTGAGDPAADFGFDTSFIAGAGADFTLSLGESNTSANLAPGTYQVTELLGAANAALDPDFAGSVSCTTTTTGSGTSSTSTTGLAATITLGAGDIVTCTYTNTQDGRIVVAKNTVNGDASFDFTGAVTGSITTVGGTGTTTLSDDVVPGTYAVAETPTPGYTLTGSACSDGSAVGSIGVAAGETVTCTFTNTRNQGTFVLRKVWGDGSNPGTTVDLSATVTGPAPLPTGVATTSTSPTTTTSNTVTVYSGQTVDFSETFSGNAGTAYNSAVGCIGGGTLTAGATGRTGSVAVGDTPGAIVCTITNTPKVTGVALQKNWATNANGGDTAVLTVSNGPAVTDSASSVAPAAPSFLGAANVTDNTAFVSVVAGDTVTFSENLGAAGANYTTTFDCPTATNDPVAGPNGTHTLAIAAADVATGDTIFCSFTNTRREVDLVVVKDWNSATIGDAVTLTATGSDTSPISFGSTAGAADETDTSGTFTVYAGETLDLAEAFTSGDVAAYATTFDCTGSASPEVGQTVTVSPVDTAITCTFVNTRRSVDVIVAKDLAPTTDPGRFDLAVNGNVVVPGAGDGATSAPIPVLVGDLVTLAETASVGDLDNYTSALACDNGVTVAGNTGTGGSFVVPSSLATGTDVTCTFTNTRRQALLTVVKSWGTSPVDNEQVSLTITGGLAVAISGSSTNDGVANDTSATSVVYAGEAVSVVETFVNGDAANFDTTLECVDGSGTVVDTAGALSGRVVVGTTPTPITCTFTNERKSAELTVRKFWQNARVGDTAGLSAASPIAAPSTATSTVTVPTDLDTTNVVTRTVYAGESVTLSETLSAPALYNTALSCDGTPIALTDRSADLAITAADQDASIVCTFTNTRKSAAFNLAKQWVGADAGDEADLSVTAINAIGPVTAVAPAGSGVSTEVATTTVYAGEAIGVSELLDPNDTNTGTYTSTAFDCLGTATPAFAAGTVTVPLTISAADVDAANATDTPIACRFTNTRRGAVTVDKTASPTVTRTGAIYTASYTLTVASESFIDETFSLSDTPGFATNATISSVLVAGPGIAGPGLELGAAGGDIVTDGTIPARSGQPGGPPALVYTVTVTFTLAPSTTGQTCSGQPGSGGFNSASVTLGQVVDTSTACVDLPAPTITVTKVRTADVATPVTATQYEAVYTITVTNTGEGPGSYTLTDTPDLGAGATLDSLVVTPTPVPGTVIGAGEVDVYSVTVRFTVAGSMTLAERACSANRDIAGQGAYNGVSVDTGTTVVTDADCSDIPAPNVALAKTVTSSTRNADGTWTVVYTLTVTNLDNGTAVGPAQYTLTDTVAFGANVTVNAIAVSPAAPGFTGVAPANVVASNVTIAAGATQSYVVTANVSINPFGANGSCTAGGGLRNDAAATLATSATPITASACAPYSTLTLTKLAPNDNGANLPASAFTLTATQNGATIISGSTPAASAVVAGSYVLDESPRLPGYTTSAYVCTGGQIAGDTVVVPVGANVICTITNDDQPVDLQITKTDGGFQAVAGGAPIPYRLVVTNVGLRNVDAGEPVTVTDVLPTGLVWVAPFPAGCAVNGQVLTCTIPGDDVQVGDAPYVIDLRAQVTLDAPSGTVTNLAFVTTQDDPACVGANCVPVCPPSSNNVACEDTPVDAAADLQIAKSASAPLIGAGGGFDWVLDVTNNGPGRAVSVVVTDTVPSSVTVTGVTSSQFACSAAGNAVTCTRAAMQPGETARITISVVVPVTAPGGTVTNTGFVAAATPETNLTNNTDDAAIQIVEQAAPTTTTVPIVNLPATGSNATVNLVRAALLLLGLGGGLLLLARRRRDGSTA
jgi:uncharacterized repeat protein (TIGR01451 family)